MGCEHSKLNTLQNEPNPSPSNPQKDSNNSHNYTKESKENIPMIKDSSKREKKSAISPLNIQIISSDQPKLSLYPSKFNLQKINICIQKIEKFEKIEQKNRKKLLSLSQRIKFSIEYLKEVIQFLGRRQTFYKTIIEEAKQKSSDNKCTECQLEAMIKQYLKSKQVAYFQVQSWVRQKTILLRVLSEELISALLRFQHKSWIKVEQIPYIINILVEDMCEKEFSFTKTLALNHSFLNMMPQIQEWDSESHQIYEKIMAKYEK